MAPSSPPREDVQKRSTTRKKNMRTALSCSAVEQPTEKHHGVCKREQSQHPRHNRRGWMGVFGVSLVVEHGSRRWDSVDRVDNHAVEQGKTPVTRRTSPYPRSSTNRICRSASSDAVGGDKRSTSTRTVSRRSSPHANTRHPNQPGSSWSSRAVSAAAPASFSAIQPRPYGR